MQRTVAGFGSESPIKFKEPIDFNPYRHRTPLQELEVEFAQEMAKVSKLPTDERKQAREDLMKRFDQSKRKIETRAIGHQ